MKNRREYGICLGCYKVISVTDDSDALYLLWKVKALKKAIQTDAF
jgi:hypothetical protein